MRKLSELLPIVRKHLTMPGKPGMDYICFAAVAAELAGEITGAEGLTVSWAVYARMDTQNPAGRPNSLLVDCQHELGTFAKLEGPRLRAHSPAYWPYRDKWLDDWQAELEGAGQ